MKNEKLRALLKSNGVDEKVIDLHVRQIEATLFGLMNASEAKAIESKTKCEELYKKLGTDGTNYTEIFREIITRKQTIYYNEEIMLDILDEIMAEIDCDVKIED